MLPRPLYQKLASAVDALARCNTRDTVTEWSGIWDSRIATAVKEHMPAGAGFDNGTTLDLDSSTGEKLVFFTMFHHMHESGFYEGWTEHRVTVRPSLIHGFTLAISGRDRNQIKDYIADCFSAALSTEFDWPAEESR